MASRGNPARPKLKASKSGSMEQYLSPKTASAAKPPSEDKLGEKSLSALDHDVEESKDKPDDSGTTLPKARLDVPSPSSTRPSKRKRPGDAPSLETSLASPRENSSDKKPRRSKGYAPPCTYDHLPALPDTIIPNLICLFVGLNPGIQTATKGHPYAHPSNLYWGLLYSSGLTPDRRLAPAEYVTLPERYALGNTNIVGRATRDGAELSKEEMVAGARVLDDKVRRWRPKAVCLVGKSIWEAVWKWKYGRALKPKEFRYGFQDAQHNMGRSGGLGGGGGGWGSEGWGGARVFVASSTSGLAASLSLKEKEEIWAQLGAWVNGRREERERAKGGEKDSEGAVAEGVELKGEVGR